MKTRTLRRLFWDIETSPNVVLSWRVGYKLNIDQANILSERAIICIGWKWEHETKPHILTWDRDHGDKAMLDRFLTVASQADEMVAHNGDKFDMPWFKTRCLKHGLNFEPSYKTVDTCAWARRIFLFNSNKLDYIANFLGIGRKIHTDFNLWKDIVLHNDASALKRMSDYCMQDVVLLEKVWARLRVAAPLKTHKAVLEGGASWACPHCGSTNVKKDKTRVTKGGTIRHQMQCNDCRCFYTISDTVYREYLEAQK